MTRRFCPRCGDTMILEYRMRRDYDYRAWVWWCPSCRYEALAKRHEYEPTAEATAEAGFE
jgi:DNA-directed RNA polymerase subunit M/transcription elongation factor TFIIS